MYSTDLKFTNKKSVVDDDDDIYSGFDEVPAALDTSNLRDDEIFQETIRTTGIGRRQPSRMATGLGRPPTTGVRVGTSARLGTGARPMTAVRAAGYTSTAHAASTGSLYEKREDTIEDKMRQMEARIMALVEESCAFSVRSSPVEGSGPTATGPGVATPPAGDVSLDYDLAKALSKAQEASSLERQLIRMQEQAGLGDAHNLDLTFAVLCNLAGQYTLSEMYTEALNTYQLLTRNKLFPHANRLKVNMGNIFFKMGEHPRALKLYRMALDQTPTAEKDLRMKVMHNIGLLLVRMGKFRDAVSNFQHIMHEQGDYQTGLHLVLCHVALADADGAKAAFQTLLDVESPFSQEEDLPVDDDGDAYDAVARDVLRSDALSMWQNRERAAAERAVLCAAAALAPLTDDHDQGLSWCVEALRQSELGAMAARLEARAALARLRAGAGPAAERLRAVARAASADRQLRARANVNLAFVAFVQGDTTAAGSLAAAACRDDPYSGAAALASALSRGAAGEWGAARDLATRAATLEPANADVLYGLGISHERCSAPEQALACYARVLRAGGGGNALALARLAVLHRLSGDTEAAEHWYQQLLSSQPLDVGVLLDLARMHEQAGDMASAHQYYADVESIWPCELSALAWLGEYTRRALQQPLRAVQYYARAARLCPNDAHWGLMIGACLRSAGRYHEALSLYKKLHQRFPDNVECLKLLVKLCGDQGLSETESWSRELKRAQKAALGPVRGNTQSSGSGASSTTSQSPALVEPSRVLTGGARDDSAANRSRLSTGTSVGSSAPRRLPDMDTDLPLPPA